MDVGAIDGLSFVRSRIMLNTAKGVGPRALVLVDEVAA